MISLSPSNENPCIEGHKIAQSIFPDALMTVWVGVLQEEYHSSGTDNYNHWRGCFYLTYRVQNSNSKWENNATFGYNNFKCAEQCEGKQNASRWDSGGWSQNPPGKNTAGKSANRYRVVFPHRGIVPRFFPSLIHFLHMRTTATSFPLTRCIYLIFIIL